GELQVLIRKVERRRAVFLALFRLLLVGQQQRSLIAFLSRRRLFFPEAEVFFGELEYRRFFGLFFGSAFVHGGQDRGLVLVFAFRLGGNLGQIKPAGVALSFPPER